VLTMENICENNDAALVRIKELEAVRKTIEKGG